MAGDLASKVRLYIMRTKGERDMAKVKTLHMGMLIEPNLQIMPWMVKTWSFESECSPIRGMLSPGQRLRVLEVHGLTPQESLISKPGTSGVASYQDGDDLPPPTVKPGRSSGYIVAKMLAGTTQLKLSPSEFRRFFVVVS